MASVVPDAAGSLGERGSVGGDVTTVSGAMLSSVRDAFRVDAHGGERWELALDLLAAGNGSIRLGDEVEIGRNTATRADGRVCFSILAANTPGQTTRLRAESDIREGMRWIEQSIARDPRLRQLCDGHGVTVDYVFDYGNGGVRLASIDATGEIRWYFDPA